MLRMDGEACRLLRTLCLDQPQDFDSLGPPHPLFPELELLGLTSPTKRAKYRLLEPRPVWEMS